MQLSQKVDRPFVLKAILVLYIILSILYIAYTEYQKFQINVAQQSYAQGRQETIEQLITQANTNCQPFPVFAGDKTVNLINVGCLQTENNSQTGSETKEEPKVEEQK